MACNLLGFFTDGNASPVGLCAGPFPNRTYGDSLSTGEPLWFNNTCIPGGEITSNLYYSDGTNIYFFNLGVIQTITPCSTPTSTPTPTPIVPTPTPTIPTTTSTPTPTIEKLPPTPTPTPSTPSEPYNLATCDIIFNLGDAIYGYVFSTNVSTNITSYFTPSPIGSNDIAHTNTKLWMYDSSFIQEYDITLSPFSVTFNRYINLPQPLGAGLGVIDNTTLVSSSGSDIVEIDITTSTAVITPKFTIPSGRFIAGDMVYTYSAPNKLICSYDDFTNTYITQHDYATGTIEVDEMVSPTIPAPYGIFMSLGDLYICNFNGQIYNFNLISPYSLTYIKTAPNAIYGASQPPECADIVISPPPICPFESYCISTGNIVYDGTYYSAGTYSDQAYWSGETNGLFIFLSPTENCWCLSNSLGGDCYLFGPSPCNNECPDLCDDFFNTGSCPTPTPTPTQYCQPISFEAAFDCELPLTPTPTVTGTPTPTPTQTPTATEICGGKSISVTVNILTPTPTATNGKMIATPTPSVQYNCNFDGTVVFNTFDDYIRCNGSKRFKDCISGMLYHTTDVVLDPLGGTPAEGYVYQSFVDGISTCISYEGFVNNVAGVNTINLTSILGKLVDGACSQCVNINTPTPTPTPTGTPTPTPTLTRPACIQYSINNTFIQPLTYTYTDCGTGLPIIKTINSQKYNKTCSSSVPTSTSSFVIITVVVGVSCFTN